MAIQSISQAYLWLAPDGNATAARQLTSGEELEGAMAWSDPTRLLAVTSAAGLISVSSDGAKATLISGGAPVLAIAKCGDTGRLLLGRYESGTAVVYRGDSDAASLTTLSTSMPSQPIRRREH